MTAPTTIDFESFKIENRPKYPPIPVGVGIWEPGRSPHYMAWGHPTGNNCTKEQAVRRLRGHFRSGRPILCHNFKFDMGICEEQLGLPYVPYTHALDTTVEAFLVNPNRKAVSLKPLAEQDLGLPPEEQEELRDWIWANVPGTKGKKKKWAEHIADASGDLVGKYCIGDVIRTRKLHDFYMPQIRDMRMLEAYERERRLFRILHEMEKAGLPVATRRLGRDLPKFERELEIVDTWIRRCLGAKELDIDSNDALADAIEDAGKIEEWILTDKGNRSTAHEALKETCLDPELVAVLSFRSTLSTCLSTFLRPWFAKASETDGLIYTNWNQVRQAGERQAGRAFGARTGRFSSNPNLQNIPQIPPRLTCSKLEYKKLEARGVDVELLPRSLWNMLTRAGIKPQYPNVRSYVIPRGKNDVLLNRDYMQQELRILAHYAGGSLLEAYLKNPKLDQHELARKLINARLGTYFRRKPVKHTGFGIIYGMGLDLLGQKTGTDRKTASTLRRAYKAIFPELGQLDADLKRRGKEGEPIRTWGGRVYYCEEPKEIKGILRTFEYKLINTLIQGSAGDVAKEFLIRYDEHPERIAELFLTVHDEGLVGCHTRRLRKQMRVMRETMESVEFDLPMPTDGTYGPTWAQQRKYRDA